MAAKIIETKNCVVCFFKRVDEMLYEYGNKIL